MKQKVLSSFVVLVCMLLIAQVVYASPNHTIDVVGDACSENGQTDVTYRVKTWDDGADGKHAHVQMSYEYQIGNVVSGAELPEGNFLNSTVFTNTFTIDKPVDRITLRAVAEGNWENGHTGGQTDVYTIFVTACVQETVTPTPTVVPTSTPVSVPTLPTLPPDHVLGGRIMQACDGTDKVLYADLELDPGDYKNSMTASSEFWFDNLPTDTYTLTVSVGTQSATFNPKLDTFDTYWVEFDGICTPTNLEESQEITASARIYLPIITGGSGEVSFNICKMYRSSNTNIRLILYRMAVSDTEYYLYSNENKIGTYTESGIYDLSQPETPLALKRFDGNKYQTLCFLEN